ARLKFLSELKIDLIELIMLEIDALALLIELTMVLQADFNVFISVLPTPPKPSKPPFSTSNTLLIMSLEALIMFPIFSQALFIMPFKPSAELPKLENRPIATPTHSAMNCKTGDTNLSACTKKSITGVSH